jgi:hypothetical protein
MTFQTGRGVDPAFDPVPVQIIAAVRERPFRRVLVLVAWLDLFLVGMAIGAERFLMTGRTDRFLLSGIKLVPAVKVVRLVIQGAPLILMALAAVDKSFDFLRVLSGNTRGVGAGMEINDPDQQWKQQYEDPIFFHSLPPLPFRTACQKHR